MSHNKIKVGWQSPNASEDAVLRNAGTNDYSVKGIFAGPVLAKASRSIPVQGGELQVDTSGNTLTEADGFFSIKRHYGSALSASHSALSGVSASNLNQDSRKNYTFKIIKSTGNSTFSFKFRGYAQTAENLPTDSQLVIIEMSE